MEAALTTGPAGFVAGVVAGVAGVLLAGVLGAVMFSGRAWRIVKSRGSYHLQFVLCSLGFVGMYTVMLAVGLVYQWPLPFIWLTIALRHWAVIFALMALLVHQVIMAAIPLPGRSRRYCCIPLTVTRTGQIDSVLRRTTLVLVGLYIPVFVLTYVALFLAGTGAAGTFLITTYAIHFAVLGLVLIALHFYVYVNWQIDQYYSHRTTMLGILIVTDAFYIGWLVALIFLLPIAINTPAGWLVDAMADTSITAFWAVMYTAQPFWYLLTAWCGFDRRLVDYERGVRPTVSSGGRDRQVSLAAVSPTVLESPPVPDRISGTVSEYPSMEGIFGAGWIRVERMTPAMLLMVTAL